MLFEQKQYVYSIISYSPPLRSREAHIKSQLGNNIVEHLTFSIPNPLQKHVKIPVVLYIQIQPHNEPQA
jgi:hypothetical protein